MILDHHLTIDTVRILTIQQAMLGRDSDDDRLQLLSAKNNLPDSFEYPATSGRRFNPRWLAG